MVEPKRGGKKFPPAVISKISLPEINKINEESFSRGTFHRSIKRQKVSSVVVVKNDDIQLFDLISRLPDDILCSIMSRLSMRDAVRTSILSRRWRHLWKTSLENIDFGVLKMPRDGTKCSYCDNNAFVKCVSQILAQLCCGTTIESFKLSRRLRSPKKYSREIDKWIQFVADKKVQKLDVDLSAICPNWEGYDRKKVFLFPYWLFSSQDKGSALKYLTLNSYTFNLPPKFSHFSSLSSLTLKCVVMTEENLINILSNCISLQCLSMTVCFCSRHLKFASGSCSSPSLKYLSVIDCRYPEMVDIRDLVNLSSFEFRGDMATELRLNQMAPVTRVYYKIVYPFQEEYLYAKQDLRLARDFPRLETLIYTFPLLKAKYMPTNLPTFAKLKHLSLILVRSSVKETLCLLEPTASLLKASPLLHKLELHLPGSRISSSISIRDWMKKKEIETCRECWQHYNLREVDLFNFHGNKREVELVEYLVKHTVSLEKIQVDQKRLRYVDGKWLDDTFRVGLHLTRESVFRMLRERIPTSTDLIVL
ncbi:F-box domain containing protein [Parasponia andersonii]|uniref:F-box domain containing protein n=1 Tax=Parasponia andersonii TaxID=3476 RepID=A0A2P5CJH6_PARAD|nr:F-box domain containing protein [Parasponia andersonii]